MIKRVVVTGCSHAFGSEMAGRANNKGHDQLSYGALLAKKYNVPLFILARPGSSNDFIKHTLHQHAQKHDLVINAWTYFDRFLYYAYDTDTESAHASSHEAGIVMGDRFPQFYNHFGWEQDRIDKIMKHRFIKNKDNPIIRLVSEYELMYYGEDYTRYMRFLENYYTVNNYCNAVGAKVINFQMDEGRKKMQQLEKLSTDHRPYQETEMEFVDEVMPDRLEDTKMYRYWKNDKTRLPKIMIKHIKERMSIPDEVWPGDRMGHLGPEQHFIMHKIIDKAIQKLGYV